MSEPDSICIERELFVPREIVFDLWTMHAHLANWYDIGVDESSNLQFQALEKPDRLGYTQQSASGTTDIVVTLLDLGGKTALEIRETGLTPERREQRTDEWHRRLDNLTAYLSSI